MKSVGSVTVVIVGIFALLGAVVVLNGVMLSYLWEWFVVPLGVQSIGVAQAIGIAIIASILTHEAGTTDPDGPVDALNKILVRILGRVFAFGIAFGISFLVPA